MTIRLDERLRCAFELLQGAKRVADIGCDHGKLSAALLLDGRCERVIAGDISADCLDKTRRLLERYDLRDRAEARLGSGLSVISPGECDGAAILGMGGELIAELLQASVTVAERMERLVLQPMSGVEELRQWLYETGYHVLADRLVTVGSRWYQLMSVRKGSVPDPWPEGFPRDCYMVGYRSFAEQDYRLGNYVAQQLQKRRIQLRQAAGTAGEARLSREAEQLERIMKEIERWS